MPKRYTYRFNANTEWSMKTDRAQVFARVHNHYGKKDFHDRCFNTLHAALKPLSMALSGSYQSEVLREVATARDRVEMLFNLAVDLAAPSPEVAAEPASIPQQPSVDLSEAAEERLEENSTVYSQQENDSPSLMEIYQQ